MSVDSCPSPFDAANSFLAQLGTPRYRTHKGAGEHAYAQHPAGDAARLTDGGKLYGAQFCRDYNGADR